MDPRQPDPRDPGDAENPPSAEPGEGVELPVSEELDATNDPPEPPELASEPE